MINKKIGFMMIVLLFSAILFSSGVSAIDEEKENQELFFEKVKEEMGNLLFFHFNMIHKIRQEHIKKNEIDLNNKISQAMEDHKKKFINETTNKIQLKKIVNNSVMETKIKVWNCPSRVSFKRR